MKIHGWTSAEDNTQHLKIEITHQWVNENCERALDMEPPSQRDVERIIRNAVLAAFCLKLIKPVVHTKISGEEKPSILANCKTCWKTISKKSDDDNAECEECSKI